MNNDQLKYGLIGLLIGGVAVWLLMTTQWQSSSPNIMGTSQLDAHFIEQMIPHHEDAITMAKLALEKASHPEIKQLAQAIIDSQSKEIDQMRSWYKEWFGRELPTGGQVMEQHGMMGGSGMYMGMMGDETDLKRLEQATDFDRAFIEEMIPHHQMAIMMASMLKKGTARPEMSKLVDDIIAAQTREIDEMRQWHNAWF